MAEWSNETAPSLTVAGPRRIRTGLPCYARRGHPNKEAVIPRRRRRRKSLDAAPEAIESLHPVPTSVRDTKHCWLRVRSTCCGSTEHLASDRSRDWNIYHLLRDDDVLVGALHSVVLSRLGSGGRIDIMRVGRPESGYFNQHGFRVSAGEMIAAARFRIHTARREPF